MLQWTEYIQVDNRKDCAKEKQEIKELLRGCHLFQRGGLCTEPYLEQKAQIKSKFGAKESK